MQGDLSGGVGEPSVVKKKPELPAGSTTPLAGGAGGNPPPGSSVTPPAPGGASSSSPPPDQEAATAPAIRLDDAMRKAAADKAEAMYRAGTDATAAYPDKIGPAIDAAASAQNQRAPLGSLANSLASAPRTESSLASGKVQEIAQPIMAVANNLASMFGIRAPAPDADLSSAELIRKNIKLLAKEASVGSLAHAAFVDMENAIPTNLNSPDAQAKMLADIFTINQRIIDRGNFHKQLRDAANGPDQRYIAQAPHAASSLDPDAEFSKRYSQAFYNDEKKALIRMFKDGPKGVTNAQGRQMSMYEYLHEKGASLSPQERAKIGKALGSPNIMRYFGLGD
jgi:hypothetical protein